MYLRLLMMSLRLYRPAASKARITARLAVISIEGMVKRDWDAVAGETGSTDGLGAGVCCC